MKSNRAGRMKTRNEFRKRVPDLGYYYIVTDTRETEKNYLEGLKQKLPEKLKDRLVIKVIKAKTEHLNRRMPGRNRYGASIQGTMDSLRQR